ncbi:MAG: APC family permease [Candidatus Bathyarchaeota archaeon]|nr:APC family permease [Candidatus Bathyarchaeota archaeon]
MKTSDSTKKKKGIGLFDIVITGLSGAIGFEIFVLLNYAYFHLAGPDIVYALVLGGIINLLIMLSYAELSSAMPLIGGEYTYIKTAYGGYIGFIAGCFRWLASIFAAALAAVAFVLQLAYLFSLVSPQLQTAILNQSWLIAVLIVAILGAIEIRGSRKIGSLIVIAFLLLFAGFIIGGVLSGLGASNTETTLSLPAGTAGVFAATVYLFPMFIGTRALVAGAASAEKPRKDIPRALILTSVSIIPLYLLLALVAAATVTPTEAVQQIPLLNLAANRIFGDYGGIVFAIAGMTACLSALGTSLSIQSSIARGMSRDGYFPKILLSIQSRFGTYYVAAIVGSLLIMALSVFGDVPFLGYAASFGSLLVFALVNLSLIKLRKTKPYMDRPFKTPFYPITPIVGVILSLALLVIPVILGDGNAYDALASSIGITGIVLASYYIRMAGRFRMQIALGGIGIGTGIVLGAISLASLAGLTTFLPFISSHVQILFSIVLIATGYYNLTAHNRKNKTEKEEEQTGLAGLFEYLVKRFKLAIG